MNRRQAIAMPFAIAVAVAAMLPKARSLTTAKDFDPFFVWRESARFDRDVSSLMQQRLGMAMAERIDKLWGIT